MPSFDAVCEPNLPEVKNAVDNTAKEIATRFDFKGTPAAIELKDKEITLIGNADFQLTQIEDILRNKLTKRSVDVRFLDMGDVQKIGGDKVKQVIKVKNGIASDDAAPALQGRRPFRVGLAPSSPLPPGACGLLGWSPPSPAAHGPNLSRCKACWARGPC